MLVDDEPRLRRTLATFLIHHNMDVATAQDGLEAVTLLRNRSFDLVVADVSMPRMGGLEILDRIRRLHAATDVIVVSGLLEIQQAVEAMRLGAVDFFTKPYNFEKILFSLERVQQNRRHLQTAQVGLWVEREVELQTETTLALGRAAEERDRMNIGHGRRVAVYAGQIGQRLCFTPSRLRRLTMAARLHDIGKIGIDDAILNKPGRLTDTEMVHMRRHSEIGEYILHPISAFREIAPIIRSHHERYDGTGYPDGLSGEDIPLDSRIICLCDFFDAITSKRPYREPTAPEQAYAMIEAEAGKFFDPMVAEVFLETRERVVRCLTA
ncbi:MAG: response regulator [Planctomycetes bacterium]|nr:response regulator [Planctomycetota bacterium]